MYQNTFLKIKATYNIYSNLMFFVTITCTKHDKEKDNKTVSISF